MNHFLLSCFFCILTTIVLVSAHDQQHAQRYCGRLFSNTLFTICTQNITKKIPMDYRNNYPDYSSEESNDLSAYFSLFRPKRMLQMRMPFELRKRQKAAEECCHRPCTLKQLQEYCPSYMVV